MYRIFLLPAHLDPDILDRGASRRIAHRGASRNNKQHIHCII
jgi:hypothetical protein